jgi:5'-nucleotidase
MTIPGGIRSGLTQGNLFYGDLVTTMPFENLLYSVELQGKVIKEALEFSVADSNSLILLQVSGLKVVYNMLNDPYNRMVSLHTLCRVCVNNIPKYEQVNDEAFYRVVMPDFLARGGDGFQMIADHGRYIIFGPRDIDALSSYVEKNSPINMPPLMGRISFI